jgi:hypothetical protein
MEQTIARLSKADKPKTYSPETSFSKKPVRPSPPPNRKKGTASKASSRADEPRVMSESQSVDYLANRRKIREDYGKSIADSSPKQLSIDICEDDLN